MSDQDEPTGEYLPDAPSESQSAWQQGWPADAAPRDNSSLSGSAELDDLIARATAGSQTGIHTLPVDSELVHGGTYDDAKYSDDTEPESPYTVDDATLLTTPDALIDGVVEYVPEEPESAEPVAPIDYTVTTEPLDLASEPIEPTLIETKLLHLDQLDQDEYQPAAETAVIAESEIGAPHGDDMADVPFESAMSEEVPFMGTLVSATPSKPGQTRIEALTAAIQHHPEAPVNFVLRGEALLDNGHDAQALADFQAALNLIRSRAKTVSWEYIDRALADRAREGLRRVRR